ncbi:MAG: hypothetical protein WKF47_05225 [Geodermatophilaceae bacterium]
MWDRIREMRQNGVTIVLTTHDMDEAATLADRVGIMDHGTRAGPGHPRGADSVACRAARRSISPSRAPAATRLRRSRTELSSVAGVEQVERVTTAPDRPAAGTAARELRVRLYLDRRGGRLARAGHPAAARAAAPGSPGSASASRAWRTSSSA